MSRKQFFNHNGYRFFLRALVDLRDVFSPQPSDEREGKGKRILIFNWRDTKHDFAGGAEVYIHELAKRWVQNGDEVTLFCGSDGRSKRNETIDGVNIVRRGGFYVVYFWAFLYYMLRFRGKFDVIIDCENGIPFFTPLYASEKKFLVIHHVHQEVFLSTLKKPFAHLAMFLEMRLMPLVYRNIQVITVSESSRKEILEHGITTIDPIVIYNGVDIELFKPGKKSRVPTVVYFGRLKSYKNITTLIEAAKLLKKQLPNVKIIIGGDGEELRALKRLVKKLDLLSVVSFTGKLTDEEKIRLYQRAWVFVNPSLREGWGITTIEANACGTPIVASDVSGLRDSVRNPHTGYLVPFGDERAFAKRIGELLTDSKLREKMGKQALEWAAQFSWEYSAQHFSRLMTAESSRSVRVVGIEKVTARGISFGEARKYEKK